MSIVLGFGKHEEDFERKIVQQCIDIVKNGKDIESQLNVLSDKYNKLERKYDKLPKDKAPERYAYLYFIYWELIKNCYGMIRMTFGHINRRHGLSPNGFASLQTRKILYWAKYGEQLKFEMYTHTKNMTCNFKKSSKKEKK